MNFSDLIHTRQSVRKYQNKPVEPEKLQQLIEAVRLAPSACNAQPWTLIMVDDPQLKAQVAEATYSKAMPINKFVPQAPMIAVLTVEKQPLYTQIGAWLKKREFRLIDIGIAASQFCLQATELGLSTCMLGWFDERRIQHLLNIPRKTRIGLLITVGYADPEDSLREKLRKDTAEMSRFNSYR